MGDLRAWQPAVPEGERLYGAAPMRPEWWDPGLAPGWRGVTIGVVSGSATALSNRAPDDAWLWVLLAIYLLVAVGTVTRIQWWRTRHPRPTGMAAVVDWPRGRGPVLLITGSGVLATGSRGTGFFHRARPAGPARELPGLCAIEAAGERLVLSFEDGTSATLRQSWPTPGAAARVVELAAPVLPGRPSKVTPTQTR